VTKIKNVKTFLTSMVKIPSRIVSYKRELLGSIGSIPGRPCPVQESVLKKKEKTTVGRICGKQRFKANNQRCRNPDPLRPKAL